MSVEIERKFLVVGDGWKSSAVHHVVIRDGLIGLSAGRKVRVRIANDIATLTVKSKRSAGTNMEFEYPIPLADAEYLLTHECDGNVLSKIRYLVPVGDLTWEVDVYGPPLDGVVLAEVELPDEHRPIEKPSWAGEDVTGRPEWKKINMLRARLGAIAGQRP